MYNHCISKSKLLLFDLNNGCCNHAVMALGANVRKFREAAGLTQTQLAEAAGMDQQALAALEKRDSRSSSFLPSLAKALNLSTNQLLGIDETPIPSKTNENVVPAPIGSHRIPLIDYVQAGAWTGVQDPFEPGAADEYLLTDLELSGSAFALEIKGESMLPEFRPGDRVIIDPEVMPSPGDFVVAKNGAEEATFKKYRPRSIDAAGNTVFELVPLNEDFPSMRSDVVPIRIVGTMVEHRKYRKKI